jgi:predicted RNA-binding protein Jag
VARGACARRLRPRARWAAEGAGEAEGAEGELIEDEAEFAAQMLDRLLELMGIQADVSIRDPETPGDGLGMAKAVLDVEGDDLGILIGRRGETLASLQYLLKSQRPDGKWGNYEQHRGFYGDYVNQAFYLPG